MKSRRGRRPDPQRAALRKVFAEWSDRTFARYWRCHQTLAELQGLGWIEAGGHVAALAAATRPNGSLNVSRLERITDVMVMKALAKVG